VASPDQAAAISSSGRTADLGGSGPLRLFGEPGSAARPFLQSRLVGIEGVNRVVLGADVDEVVRVPIFGAISDLHPADSKKRPSKRRFHSGVVQNSARVHLCSDLLQTCGKLGVFAGGKVAEFRAKNRIRPLAVHTSRESPVSAEREWAASVVQSLSASSETRRAFLGTNFT
jgi:hypothetical protein